MRLLDDFWDDDRRSVGWFWNEPPGWKEWIAERNIQTECHLIDSMTTIVYEFVNKDDYLLAKLTWC